METRCYRLKLRGALHLGTQGFANEGTGITIPSDTLFSAIVVAWVQLGKDINTLLEAFKSNETPPLLLTSTFPYANNIRFYPRPFLSHRGITTDEAITKTRKYNWVSQNLFEKLVLGKSIDEAKTSCIQNKQIWLSKEEEKQLPSNTKDLEITHCIWKKTTSPRVTLDRINNSSQIYHIGRVQYAPECGLWFAAKAKDETWFHHLESALDLLSDTGIGGLRSIGHGAFACEYWEEAILPKITNQSDYSITLSRYAPKDEVEIREAMLDSQAIYKLVKIDGWAPGKEQKAWRRKSVRMVEEGALLHQPFTGHLVDVTPEIGAGIIGHNIYRYGFAFPLPVTINAIPGEKEIIYG